MNAIPQPKTHQIVDRINALQAASPRFIDASGITPLSREWRGIRRDIDQLMQVDACAAWELMGSWRALAGDVEGAEAAFRNSMALGQSDVGRENWMITRLNLGMFSGAQEIYRELGMPRTQDLAIIARYGFIAGAVGWTARLIEDARGMGFEWEEGWAREVMLARGIIDEVRVTDDEISQRLDCAGVVLRRNGLRPLVDVEVSLIDGVHRGVTYKLVIPLAWEHAHEMDRQLLAEDDKLDFFTTAALGVYFDGRHS
jgi:hypothetical protein